MGVAGRPAPGSGRGRTLRAHPSTRAWSIGASLLPAAAQVVGAWPRLRLWEGDGPPVQLQRDREVHKQGRTSNPNPSLPAVHINSYSVQTGEPAQHVEPKAPMFNSGGGLLCPAPRLFTVCARSWWAFAPWSLGEVGPWPPWLPDHRHSPSCAFRPERARLQWRRWDGGALSGPGRPGAGSRVLLNGPRDHSSFFLLHVPAVPAFVPLPCGSQLARAPPPHIGRAYWFFQFQTPAATMSEMMSEIFISAGWPGLSNPLWQGKASFQAQ